MASSAFDHRDFSVDGKAPKGRPFDEKSNTRWWLLDEPQAIADAVTATMILLREAQDYRILRLTAYARLYGNMPIMGSAGLTDSRVTTAFPWTRSAITYNALQSAVDTVTAKIAKNKPRPLFVTNGAEFHTWRKAKRLNRFMDGVFYENEMPALATLAFRDSAIWGDGIVHVYFRDGRVRYERVLPQEIWVDEQEALVGKPRSMHRIMAVDRRVLTEMFPDHADEIQRAAPATLPGPGRPSISDLVDVRESWHIPSSEDANDGRHVITIAGACLTDMEEWNHPWFPFTRMRWSPRQVGFWSQSLAEQVQSLQLEMNKLMWIVQRSFHLAGTFKVLLEMGSKIVKEHLNNDVGAMIEYQGKPPEYITTPVAAVEYFEQISNIKNMIYEQAGVSQLSASGLKPAGLDSGEAQRVYNNIESERFMTIGQEFERFHVETGRMSIDIMRDGLGRAKSYKVRTPGGKFLREIDWRDIDLARDQYEMQCFPVSSLPNEPAGRIAQINDWVQAGWLDPDEARRLQGVPDLEQVESLQEAQEDVILQALDRMVDEGIPSYPEPFDNLPLALKLALRYYARGKTMDLEEERLELLRQYITNVQALVKEQAAAMAPPPAANSDVAAPAPPVPLNPSPLVPNVPPQLRAA